ncbi:hypothetical protein N7456_013633 [Penicillium angulare]|uniref:Uncharacterized protein n=1 Tax=Penicillium angulare TaxID=116970 RepID=A0A9W9JSV3_9EURO|nr:hypothetical protein N7456_013633 [Penicillium angulare]
MTQNFFGMRYDPRYNALDSIAPTVTRIFWHRRFHSVRRYGLHGDNRLHYGHIPFVHKYDRAFFFDVLIDEYNLRMSLQEQERIERRINSLLPPPESDDHENEEWTWGDDEAEADYSDLSPLLRDSSGVVHHGEPKTNQIPVCPKTLHSRVPKSHEKGIKILQQKLEDTKYQHRELTHKLHEAETMLPDLIRQNYEYIRKDPKWYMRNELVKDCADRGGCCGRECGCCALRANHFYTNGVGHCTVECFCCVGFRGFRPSPEEKTDILKRTMTRLKQDTAT